MTTEPYTLLKGTDDGEIRCVYTLDILRPYSVLHMELIPFVPHSMAVFTVREVPQVDTNIPIPNDILSEEEEFNINVGFLTT